MLLMIIELPASLATAATSAIAAAAPSDSETRHHPTAKSTLESGSSPIQLRLFPTAG